MRKILAPLVFCALLFPAGRAGALDFSWSLGEMEVYYGSAANHLDGNLSLLQFNLLLNKKLGLAFHFFEAGILSDEGTISYAFMPARVEYRLVNFFDTFYISVYGKGAWLFTQDQDDFNPFAPALNHGFSGAGGLRFLLPLPLGLHYTGALAVFAEYGFPEGFKVGVSVDLLAIFAIMRD
jgi:hypothetical protein